VRAREKVVKATKRLVEVLAVVVAVATIYMIMAGITIPEWFYIVFLLIVIGYYHFKGA